MLDLLLCDWHVEAQAVAQLQDGADVRFQAAPVRIPDIQSIAVRIAVRSLLQTLEPCTKSFIPLLQHPDSMHYLRVDTAIAELEAADVGAAGSGLLNLQTQPLLSVDVDERVEAASVEVDDGAAAAAGGFDDAGGAPAPPAPPRQQQLVRGAVCPAVFFGSAR